MLTKRLQSLTIAITLGLGLTLALFALLHPRLVPVVYAANIAVNSTADTITVDGTCTLREAIINANNDNQSGSTDCVGGTGADTITLPAGTHILTIGGAGEDLAATGDLDITEDLNIVGVSAGTTIVQGDGAFDDRIFDVLTGTVVISAATIRYGHTTSENGGGLWNSDNLTLNNSIVTSNTARFSGGGVYNRNGTLTVVSSIISDNITTNAGGDGGGIGNNNGTVILDNSTVMGNTAWSNGGGIQSDSILILTNTLVTGNKTTSSNGAGILNSGQAIISNSQIISNTASVLGGGIWNESGGQMSIINSQILSNTAPSSGGGILNSGIASLTNTTIISNSSAIGGAIYNSNQVIIDGGQIIKNTANGPGGGIFNTSGTVALVSTDVNLNTTLSSDGGGLHSTGVSTVTLDSVTFNNNTASIAGGAIYNGAGTLTITNSQVATNTANGTNDGGGGIYNGSGTVVVVGSNLFSNTVTGSGSGGGAIANNGGILTIDASTLSSNVSTSYDGGGVYNINAGTLTVTDSTFDNNNAGGVGGGLTLVSPGSAATVSNSTFSKNSANSGGAVYVAGSTVATMSNTKVTTNTATGGGGVFNAGTLTLADMTFNNNDGTGSSGGGLSSFAGTVNLANSTFYNNQANWGGGIHSSSTIMTITNTTVSSNTSAGVGGGIYNDAISTMLLTNTTVSSNTSLAGGGIYNDPSASSLTMKNSIVAYSSSGNNCDGNLSTFFSAGYNLSSDASCTPLTSTGDITNTDPLLGPLQNNGGSTETHLPASTSPVINAGDPTFTSPPNFDQRGDGFPRVLEGRVDIGSVETTRISDCFARVQSTGTVYTSSNASAVQQAINAANNGDTVKVAGYCAGVTGGQTVSISKNITVTGGYTNTNWLTYQPGLYIPTLDALGIGRVVSISNSVDVLLESLRVYNGQSPDDGGGIYVDDFNATVSLSNTLVYGNATGSFSLGGGLYSNGDVYLTNSTVMSNSADGSGGGLYVWNAYLNNSTLSDNTSTFRGGGLNAVEAHLTKSTVSNNTAGDGGGLLVGNTVHLTSSLVIHNVATYDGGGLYLSDGDNAASQVVNSLIAANRAGSNGQGIFLFYIEGLGGVMNLIHTTIASPTTGSGSAIYVDNFSGVLNITNTIIASYTTDIELAGGTANEDYNLFPDGLDTLGNGTVNSGGNSITGTTGFVDPAANNYRLNADSVAVDTGTNLGITADFEGDTRPFPSAISVPDIGYDESPYLSGLVPPTGLTLSGPIAGVIGVNYAFTAVVSPANVTTPVTYTWQATDQTPIVGQSTVSNTVGFTWPTLGVKTITVTADNGGGIVTATHLMTIVSSDVDLEITKVDTPDPAVVGGNLVYTVTVKNNSLLPATGIKITDTLPAGLSFASMGGQIEPANVICTLQGSNVLVCNVNIPLNAGQSLPINLNFSPSATGNIVNSVEVSANQPDPIPGNNTASATTTVIDANANLSISKSASPASATVGEALVYTIVFTNHGPSDVFGVTVVDSIPAGLTFGSVSAGAGIICNPSSSTVTCNLDSMTAGSQGVITLVTTPTLVGTYINTATVTASVANDTFLADNTDSVATAVAGLEIIVSPGSSDTITFNDSQGNQTTVEVPIGAVAETIKLVYIPVTPSTGSPSGTIFAGHGFTLKAYTVPGDTLIPGYIFSQPVKFTIEYSDNDIAGVNDEAALAIYYLSGTTWIDVATTCPAAYTRNTGANTLSIDICHLTEFGLFGPTDITQTFLPIILKNN